MSDTPRTDKAERTADTLNVMDAFEYAIYHGQKLERELAEAMQRIKKLEEAAVTDIEKAAAIWFARAPERERIKRLEEEKNES